MPHSLDDVACAGFAFCADEGGSFGDTTERFAQIAGTTHERDFEVVFVDVVFIVSWREDLGFINVIDTNGLKDLFSCVSIIGRWRRRRTECDDRTQQKRRRECTVRGMEELLTGIMWPYNEDRTRFE